MNLPAGIYSLLLEYGYVCDNLRQPDPHCQITKVLTIIGELLARQDSRGGYVGKSDGDCQKYFFNQLRQAGISLETLDLIDTEHGKLQDEKIRVRGLSREDFADYVKKAVRIKTKGVKNDN